LKRQVWLPTGAFLLLVLTLASCGSAASTSPPAGTVPPASLTTTGTGGIPAIPADHGQPVDVRHRDCLACHQTSSHGASAVPADHGNPVDAAHQSCQACHEPA
jgi:hypothetical protein